jgi:uncharacterized damage-inducible protein DinB
MSATTAAPTVDWRAEALDEIAATRRFFDRTTSVFDEADSLFRATPETMTVASQVAHAAQVIDWFREGSLHDRWDLDFEKQTAVTDAVTSLTEARRWLGEAWERLRAEVATLPEAKLLETMADNPIVPGRPRLYAVKAVVDHCGHHRGALAVYARLAGKVPPMPYGED